MNLTPHNRTLDGLRGLAACIVLYGHADGFFGVSRINPSFLAAKSGVYIFFVLSAYLLAKQILVAALDRESTIHFLSEYFFRRCNRILPLYLLAITAYYSVSLLVPGKGAVILNFSAYLNSLTMNKGYGHFWTVPVEFCFYFILPIIVLPVRASGKGRMLVVVGCVFWMVLSAITFDENLDYGLVPLLHIFLCGVLIAIFDTWYGEKVKGFGSFLAACVGFTALTILFCAWPFLGSLGYEYSRVENMRVFWALIASCLTLGCIWGMSWFRAIFEISPLRYMGAISYSAYLWHILIYAAMKNMHFIPSPAIKCVLAWLFVIVFAQVSYFFIEMRIYKSTYMRSIWSRLVDRWLPARKLLA